MRCFSFIIALSIGLGLSLDSAANAANQQSLKQSTRRTSHNAQSGLVRNQDDQDRLDADKVVEVQDEDNAPRFAPGQLVDESSRAPSVEVTPGSGVESPIDQSRGNEYRSVVKPDLNFDDDIVSPAQQTPIEKGNNGSYSDSQIDSYGCGYDACGTDLCFNQQARELFPTCNGWHLGGWLQGGYHDGSDGLLNTQPDEFNFHQGWFTLERRVNVCQCGWDWGFRFDGVYGTDAYALQSFGNNPGEWDFQNGQDHGIHAWAAPQLYGEIQAGAWNFKAGHFLADFNFESFESPTNFFYSRSYASVLAAPITLTGFVTSYDTGNNVWSAGYTTGWDTGFDTFANGGSFIGSVKSRLSNNSAVSYTVSAGDFGRRGEGYAHSIIYDRKIGCRWNYAFETTYLQSDLIAGGSNDNAGITQYLIYRWSNKIDVGQRLEWWKSDINGAGSQSTWAYSAGLNYRVNSNINVRPELRYNWGTQFNNAAMETPIFGVDAIVRF